MGWNLRRGRKRIDACSTTEDVLRSTIRQKRTGDSRFLPPSSGRLENYDSSDPTTAAKGSAQRSMSLGATSPHVGHLVPRSANRAVFTVRLASRGRCKLPISLYILTNLSMCCLQSRCRKPCASACSPHAEGDDFLLVLARIELGRNLIRINRHRTEGQGSRKNVASVPLDA